MSMRFYKNLAKAVSESFTKLEGKVIHILIIWHILGDNTILVMKEIEINDESNLRNS
jgi:hypothetical protein